MRRRAIASAAIFALAVNASSQSINLPLDHWAYAYLAKLEAKGLFRDVALRSLPLSRGEVVAIIVRTDSLRRAHPEMLTKAETALFEQLKGEFCDDRGMEMVAVSNREREPHLLRWREGEGEAFVDALFRQNLNLHRGDSFAPTARISETTAGGILRGSLADVHFYLDARNTLIRGSDISEEQFDPAQGEPVVTSGSNVYRDQAEAYTSFRLSKLTFELGRSEVYWGPGWRGALALSNNAPLLDMLKLKVLFRCFKFTSLHGILRSSRGSRYIAAHRIDLKITSNLYVSGTETVVYGGRDVELAYLNPLMPYHVAEHHLGDRDNNTMGFDVTAFPLRTVKLYAELFLDDMTLSENLFRYYGNKFGVLCGCQWLEPFGARDLALRAEYTRIEPYVYTHDDSLNRYIHYDRVLGHWLGPNADCLALAAEHRFSRDISAQVIWQAIRHGEGHVNTPHQRAWGTAKQFLGQRVERSRGIHLEISDQIRRDIFLTLRYAWISTDNVKLQPGVKAVDQHALFQLKVNY